MWYEITAAGPCVAQQQPVLYLCRIVFLIAYTCSYTCMQQWKHHPQIAKQLEGGSCISYGARVLNEGAIGVLFCSLLSQSLPVAFEVLRWEKCSYLIREKCSMTTELFITVHSCKP